jgi:cytochrome P450
MFSTRDPAYHQALKRSVSQKFSMSSIKAMETLVDDCNGIFLSAMKEMQGKSVDLGEWLQWYAFDVIGAITFQKKFGFMEKRQDVKSMIGDIDKVLRYAAIIGQTPKLHRYMMGHRWVAKFLSTQPFVRVPDPLRTIVSFTQECIDEYDNGCLSRDPDRPDFLAWLRDEATKGKPMAHRDLINHLSNNL